MLTLSFIVFVIFIITIIFFIIIIITREKAIKENEKITPFECGFSPLKKARRPFSMRFFIVTLIFLIFDIEIALLLPIGILSKIANNPIFTNISFIIVIILTLGLIHEWKQGALNWIL